MKKIDVLNLANPFWGNAGTASPAAEGMARNWNWLKAQTGNTHPGALLPCGWVSAVPYSGAYSTGYGISGVSCTGPAPVAFDRKYAWGVTHFHTSGVGYLGYFYNYFLLTAAIESADISIRSRLDNENAHPGYYSGTMSDYGVDFELTSGKYAAFHRYRFTADSAKIRLNVRQLGLEKQLLGNRKPEVMEDWSLEQDGSGAYSGSVTGNGIKIFYAVKLSGNIISETIEDGVAEIKLSGNNAQAVLAFSLCSAEEAKARLTEALETGFDQTEKEAKAQWTKRLGAIRAEFSKESDARIFYSIFYHQSGFCIVCRLPDIAFPAQFGGILSVAAPHCHIGCCSQCASHIQPVRGGLVGDVGVTEFGSKSFFQSGIICDKTAVETVTQGINHQ